MIEFSPVTIEFSPLQLLGLVHFNFKVQADSESVIDRPVESRSRVRGEEHRRALTREARNLPRVNAKKIVLPPPIRKLTPSKVDIMGNKIQNF